MMRSKFLVAAMVVLATASMATAADSAWFSLESTTAIGVTSTGGPGQTLVIDKPQGPGTFHFTIGYNFTNVGQFGAPAAMSGWGFTLGPVDLMAGTQNAQFGAGNFALSQAGNYDLNIPNIDAGAAFSAGAASFTNTGGAGLVFTFDIWITKVDSSITNTYIFGDLAPQFASSGYAWFGSIGPNAGRYGVGGTYNNRLGELPVITIRNVPEPATIALIGMGVVALIRRRR